MLANDRPGVPASASPSRWWIAAAYLLVIALAVHLSIFEINNDDAGFHVATGRFIRATGQVPARNPFSYAEDGATWIQHQWLPAVGISWIADQVGAQGLILVKAAFVGLLVVLAAWWSALRPVPLPWGPVALTIAVTAGAFRFKERPLLVSVLAVCAVVGLLLQWRDRGLRGWRRPALAAAIPAVCIHLHAGGLYGFLAWMALAGGQGAQWLQTRDKVDFSGFWRVLGFLVAGVLVAVVSLAAWAPSGLSVLTLPFAFGSHGYWVAHLAEFRPMKLVSWALLQWQVVALVVICAALAAWRKRWFELFVLGGFAYLGVRHQRLILPMAMATAPAVAAVLADERVAAPLRRRPAVVGGWVLLAALALQGALDQAAWQRMGLGSDGLDRRRHPVELMDRAAQLPGRAFISDGLAGVYLWRHFDKGKRVLVHNCLECYRESTYIDVYQRIRYGEPGWQQLVKKLRLQAFLIKHTSAGERRFQGGKPNVRQHLFASRQWLLVDFNDVAALWVHRDVREHAGSLLGRYPIDPDTGRPRHGATWPQVRDALRAHAAQHPEQTRALVILAHRAASAGDREVLAGAVQAAIGRGANERVVAELTAVMRSYARSTP